MTTTYNLKKMGILYSAAIYLPASLLVYFSIAFLIPCLSEQTGLEIIICWFMVSGLCVFIPLLISVKIILKSENYRITYDTWKLRLRFSKVSIQDITWSITGLLFTGLLSAIIMKGLVILSGQFDYLPAFISFEPFSEGRYWILAIWFPHWLLNIFGEEILWRGVMLPRQEVVFGKYTWFIHGLGWGIFHLAFGWQLLLALTPLFFIQSYVVQKTKNSWTGVDYTCRAEWARLYSHCVGINLV
ncbi:MAG: CPBP family intramembrane metalloprotease [Calditrichaceae bacterium]|nr:CPBP family intramembrane metalloprotease [Calditrichaceae bacterium]MBN2709407.1 CPBP family intramembrane metalloprotease [Calditrichaceae bacterium]